MRRCVWDQLRAPHASAFALASQTRRSDVSTGAQDALEEPSVANLEAEPRAERQSRRDAQGFKHGSVTGSTINIAPVGGMVRPQPCDCMEMPQRA